MDEDKTTTKRPVPPMLVGKGFQPGVSGNPSGRRAERKIDGVPISKMFNENLGPAAIKVIEKVLHGAVKKTPDKITKIEVELARFMHDKVYGKAIERIEMEANVTQQPAFVTTNLTIEQMQMIAGSVVEAEFNEVDGDDE